CLIPTEKTDRLPQPGTMPPRAPPVTGSRIACHQIEGGPPMKRRTFLRSALAIGALGSTPLPGLERAFAAPAAPIGPLLTKWGGPYGGIPPFGTVKATDIKPGLMKGMDLLRAEITQIAADKAAPTFENTLARYEDSGRPLGQAVTFFDIYTGTMKDKAIQAGRGAHCAGVGR